jgi:hypothetical protein
VSRTFSYAAACLALSTLGILVSWLTMSPEGFAGVVTAAALAVPFQIAAFSALKWAWERPKRVLAVWIGSGILRLALIGVAVALVSAWALPVLHTLLALTAFLFVMLILEPVFMVRSSIFSVLGSLGARS